MLSPPRIRLAKVDEFQFLTCLQRETWGASQGRFRNWLIGDFLVFLVGRGLAGVAQVAGEPFYSTKRIWTRDVYPHRIPLRFAHVIRVEHRPSIAGDIVDALRFDWGFAYGWGIRNQVLLSEEAASAILRAFQASRNDLPEMKVDIDRLLEEAKPDG